MSSRRKVGMTSSPHGPYAQGYTRATMVGTKGCEAVTLSESQKAGLSSDRSLQLDSLKSESLVIAITSDSDFKESSCRLLSELRPAFWDSLSVTASQPFVPTIVARV